MRIMFLFFFVPVSFCSYAQNNTSRFETYMQGQANLTGFNGNVLVSKNGHVIYKKSFGYSDYSTKKELDSNSIFDCGSIAKEFTAMGILLLKDKGRIMYTDTLGKYFPELPYTSISVQQLLTHTSGVPNGFAVVSKIFDHEKIASNDDMIRLLAHEHPEVLFKAGENLMYSGTGFNLLASIIEKISGRSYRTYMEEEVFKPLGMAHTSVANGPRSSKNITGFAYGYAYSDSLKRYVRADSLHSGYTSYLAGITGEGMIITTTGDLFLWDRALKNHSLLTEETQQAMLSQQAERKTVPKVKFGYGMRVGNNDFGNYIFHNGFFPGYISMHLRYTGEDITVIVLSNNESHAEFIADALSGIILNKSVVMPYVHKEIAIRTVPPEYAGNYMMQPGMGPYMAKFPVQLVIKSDQLFIHPANGADILLKQESKTKFFFGDGSDQQIEFETNKSDNVNIWHIAYGLKRTMEKIE